MPGHAYSRRSFLARLATVGALPILAGCATSDPANAPVSRPPRTAMLLPLSGPRADLGQTMARAVWLVEDRSGLPQRVEIFDTGPSPQGAATAAAQAVAAGAEVIVGPLFSDHTTAVLESAPKARIMTLSNNDRLAASGAWVFGVTPAQSAKAAAGFAAKQGARSISILQPSGDFGGQSAEALARAAKANRMTAIPAVGMQDTDNLLAALRARGAGQLPDSLYLPTSDATSRRAARIAADAGISVIGSLQWADAPSEALKGIETLTFAGPDPQLFTSLSATYRSALGEEMGIISGLAVDAVMFASALPRDRNGRVQMTAREPLDGLLGQCAFRKDRTCARDLAMLQMKGGQLRKVA
ncbi:penicillin-binding protein activator [Roseobacter sp. YSTF-M11]|uniref:Penicillin-binding protein activator n=1 Tax=Roseobacter insulae TaxID=2859783 RepID=A0A9X1FUN0_9RHOB|nr:penicillin-binding protein activator [Roseobacter insulae]MBW4707425.1 penicillin-binding protein activator [Roseobacter insulae]